ncbi:MAG: TIGR02679 family protein [Gammaproteobacteria bacterium]|nr:TIGR02679 family protein [Gammaproteobacteria bacterium]
MDSSARPARPRARRGAPRSVAGRARTPARTRNRPGTLAAGVLHDAHGLDPGRPVAGLVRSALASWFRDADGTGPDRERALWARAGVLVGGDITSTVLALGLQADDEGATGRMMNALTAAGEPGYLTLRQLVRDRPRWAVAGREVFVCENPAVVAEAAEHLGSTSAPLIATLGRPSAAALTLLGQLRDAGARLHYRGDLDWPGISIANDVIRQFDARPWRLDVATLAACSDLPGSPLHGRPVEACWNERLAGALLERGSALQEEQLIELLLSDLADDGQC